MEGVCFGSRVHLSKFSLPARPKKGPAGPELSWWSRWSNWAPKAAGKPSVAGASASPSSKMFQCSTLVMCDGLAPEKEAVRRLLYPCARSKLRSLLFLIGQKKARLHTHTVHLDLVSSTCSYCKLYPGVLIKLFNLCTRKRIYEYAQIYCGIFCGSLPKHSSFKITQKKKSWSRGVA